MGGEKRSATSTFHERVGQAVEREFREASAARWEAGPEVFLWRARRCAEALLYALLAQQKVDIAPLAQANKTLDELLKHDQLKSALPREMRTHFDLVRQYGNAATHFQIDGGGSEASAGFVAGALAEIVRWFFAEEGRSPPEAFAALTDRSRRLRSRYEQQLDQANDRIGQLQRTLSETRAAPPAQPPRQTRLAALVGFGVATTVLGLLIGRASVDVGASAAEVNPTTQGVEDVPPTAPEPVAVVMALPQPPPSPEPPPTPLPAPPAPPEPSHPRIVCPSSMVRIPATGTQAEFCLDTDSVLTRAYREFVAERPSMRPRRGVGCNWQNGRDFDGNPANCVPWASALAYCQWKLGDTGDLPTRDEWLRARPSRQLRYPTETREWSADPPNGARRTVRGDRRGSGFVWSEELAERGDRSVSFRCVLRDSPSRRSPSGVQDE